MQLIILFICISRSLSTKFDALSDFTSNSSICGSNLYYTIETDQLIILGTGTMYDYEILLDNLTTSPWEGSKQMIQKIAYQIIQ